MSNYTKTTDFEAKDSLPTGDSGKIIRGAEFETEFDAISTAIATKADTAGPTFTGTLTFATISDGTIGVTAFVDEDNMSSNSATLVPTQQSVKAYVDAQVTAQDLDFQADSGGALSIDLDSEALTFTGGTGVDTSGSGNAVTFAIDSTVATLTGTQTLTNKTLTSPDVNTPDIDGGTIDGTVIGGATPAAVSATTVSATGNITVGGTVDGRDVATDGTKLDGIEASATADQTAAEIRTLVGSASDSNVFTDADHSKLDGIEASATADQTAAEIRTLVESASDSNVFTDADHTKLNAIEASATADQTDAEIRAAVEAATDSNVFTDADHTKLNAIEASADVTDTANVTAAGALMDSELTSIASVKALNQGVATTDSPTFAGLTTTANVSFGDNDKAIFGAGSDLQIYSDGDSSYLKENSATGSLFVDGDNIRFRTSDGSKSYALFTNSGSARLYHDNSIKIETTATGIDVTGTVTADGAEIDVTRSDTAGSGFLTLDLVGTGGDFAHRVDTSNAYYLDYYTGSAWRPTIKIEGQTGDISFYEDTGTTAKFFWDASAESLGIGTSSPVGRLHSLATAAGDTSLSLQLSGSSRFEFQQGIVGVTGDALRIIDTTLSRDYLMLRDGNVGIGISSPSQTLHLKSVDPVIRLEDSNPDGVYAQIDGAGGSLILSADQGNGSANSNIVFKSDNTERMRIDSSGNLLVGKTSTTFGTVGVENRADGRITSTRSGNTNLLLNRLSSDGDLVQFYKDGTTVGSIGTVSGYLYVGGTAGNDAFLSFGADGVRPATSAGAARDAAIDLGGSTNRFKDLYLSGTANVGSEVVLADSGTAKFAIGNSSNDFYIYSNAAGSERMRIDSSGNVGIGTSSPAKLLEAVATGAGSDITALQVRNNSASTSTSTSIRFVNSTSNTSTAGGAEVSAIRNANDGGSLTFKTAANSTATLTEAMRIDSSGYLNIGVSSAISTSTNTSDGFTFAPIGGYAWLSVSDAGGIYVQRQNDNSVFSFYRGSSSVGSIGVTSSSTTYNTSSDQRLKDNIVDAPSASDDIDAIQVRSFDWKTNGSHQKYGMVAQELNTVAPEAVSAPEDPEEMMGVDYSKLVPMLVKEIQSLRARVAQLETN